MKILRYRKQLRENNGSRPEYQGQRERERERKKREKIDGERKTLNRKYCAGLDSTAILQTSIESISLKAKFIGLELDLHLLFSSDRDALLSACFCSAFALPVALLSAS